jgi:hypothetical protein
LFSWSQAIRDVGMYVGRVDHRLGRLVGRDLGRRLFGWPVSRQANNRLFIIDSAAGPLRQLVRLGLR